MSDLPREDREITISLGELTDIMSEVGANITSVTRGVFGDAKADEVMNITAYYAAKLVHRLFEELEVEK